MNPQEFSWTEDQQVTVTNPTSEAYKFKVHNKEYELGAGKSAKMPGYIAWVYVYGLATQICQADGKFNRWNEEGFRQEYYEKLVSGVDSVVQDVVVEEPNLVEELDNTADDLPEDSEPDSPDEQEDASAATGNIAPMTPKKARRGSRSPAV